MIVALDLDDTLYPEITYVESGFRAVAASLAAEYGVDEGASYALMRKSLEDHGRGRQFDDVLHRWGLQSRERVRYLLSVYRTHVPSLELPVESRMVLEQLTSDGHALYLVTDGNKLVQAAKVRALGLGRRFRHCYLTSRYGRSAAKPATRVFELMLARERAQPSDLVHVGDDPSKDFLGVNRLGGKTVRVLTGRCAAMPAPSGYDADVTIKRLRLLPAVLRGDPDGAFHR
jgi:putative hydrolase of the HAD superfamily